MQRTWVCSLQQTDGIKQIRYFVRQWDGRGGNKSVIWWQWENTKLHRELIWQCVADCKTDDSPQLQQWHEFVGVFFKTFSLLQNWLRSLAEEQTLQHLDSECSEKTQKTPLVASLYITIFNQQFIMYSLQQFISNALQINHTIIITVTWYVSPC